MQESPDPSSAPSSVLTRASGWFQKSGEHYVVDRYNRSGFAGDPERDPGSISRGQRQPAEVQNYLCRCRTGTDNRTLTFQLAAGGCDLRSHFGGIRGFQRGYCNSEMLAAADRGYGGDELVRVDVFQFQHRLHPGTGCGMAGTPAPWTTGESVDRVPGSGWSSGVLSGGPMRAMRTPRETYVGFLLRRNLGMQALPAARFAGSVTGGRNQRRRPCGRRPVVQSATETRAMTVQTPATDPLRWLRDARFGLFIHWGLYASPHPPHWRPQELEQQGEWIMYSARVPLDEYRRLAERFNPRELDADAW